MLSKRATTGSEVLGQARSMAQRPPGLTMPKRFSTLLVSMVCRAGTSTRNIECCGLKGMMVVSWLVCDEQSGV